MKYTIRFFTFCAMAVFICLILLPLPGHTEQTLDEKTAKIVSGVEEKYANKSFSADFEQMSRLTALDVTEIATGKAWFSHPGKMKWAYNSPDTHEIISNGKKLWIYRPEEKQVMAGDAAQFLQSGSGGTFLADIRKIREEFTIEPGESDDKLTQLVLTPIKPTPELAKIYITVKCETYEIPVVVTENVYGDSTRFIFTNIQFSTFDEKIFEFTPPQGAEIIEMNQ